MWLNLTPDILFDVIIRYIRELYSFFSLHVPQMSTRWQCLSIINLRLIGIIFTSSGSHSHKFALIKTQGLITPHPFRDLTASSLCQNNIHRAGTGTLPLEMSCVG